MRVVPEVASDPSTSERLWMKCAKSIALIDKFPALDRYAPIFFFKNLHAFTWIFWLLTLNSVIATVLGFWSILLVGEMISDANSLTVELVAYWYLPALIATFVIKEALEFFTRRWGEAFATVYADHLSLRFWITVLNGPLAPLRNLATHRVGAIIDRYVGNVRSWADDWFWGTSRKFTQLLIIVGVLYAQNPWVLLGNVIYLSIFLSVSFKISGRFAGFAERYSAQVVQTNTLIGGFLNNLPVIRRLRIEEFFADRALNSFGYKWQRFDEVRNFHARRWFLQLNIYWFSYLLTLGYGAIEVSKGQLPVGFLLLIKYAFDNLYQILVYGIEYRVALVQQVADAELLEREFEVLSKSLNANEPQLDSSPVVLEGWKELKLSNVVVSFESAVQAGAAISIEIDELIIRPGSRIGILGPSGVGKSTLLHVILGMQPCEGEIMLDGASIRGRELSAKDVALINSSDPLFNLSISDNIVLGRRTARGANDDRLRSSLVLAQAEFIKADDATIGDASVNLSAGQLQRIRIARGAYEPGLKLILLDEPFNGIDRRTAQLIAKNLQKGFPDAAFVLVTHNQDELAMVEDVYRFEGHKLTKIAM